MNEQDQKWSIDAIPDFRNIISCYTVDISTYRNSERQFWVDSRDAIASKNECSLYLRRASVLSKYKILKHNCHMILQTHLDSKVEPWRE